MAVSWNFVVLGVVTRMTGNHELGDWVLAAMLLAHPAERSENERVWRNRGQKAISRFERHVHVQEHDEWMRGILGDRIIEQMSEAQIHVIDRLARACLA